MSESQTESGLTFTVDSDVPQEAVDYAFDQFADRPAEEPIETMARESIGDAEVELDYEGQELTFDGTTLIERVLIEAVSEGLRWMAREVELGERDDYTEAELTEAMDNLSVSVEG